MKRIISFLSIVLLFLFYVSYSQNDCGVSCGGTECQSTTSVNTCSCNNGHNPGIALTISNNGIAVNKIGASTYYNIAARVADIITTPTAQIGIYTFSDTWTSRRALATLGGVANYGTMDSTITNLASESIAGNHGNRASLAMSNVITTLQGSSLQKFHVMITAGNPLIDDGTTTTAEKFDDPCTNGITAKKANIQTFVVLIGSEGNNFLSEYYSCLVENPLTDLIIVDPTSPNTGLIQLSQRLCKVSGIDLKITEVNPLNAQYKPFIEVLNRGKSASVSACFSGSCSSAATVGTGAYYTGYGTGAGTTPSVGVTASGLGAASGQTGWTATAVVGGVTYDTVAHGTTGALSGVNYWTVAATGYSYELRAVGYNNDYGSNWRQSCYQYLGGTPGVGPSDCVKNNGGCSDSNCNLNGGSGVICEVVDDAYCSCPTTLLGDVQNCIPIPIPSTSCHGYVILDATAGKNYMHFVWDRVEWDGPVTYTMTYLIPAGNTNQKVTGGVAGGAVSDYRAFSGSGPVQTILTVQYTSPLENKQYTATQTLQCVISTLAPTISPTTQPTMSPVNVPTTSPTAKPTYDVPGVYLDVQGVGCSASRCECFNEIRGCCIPNLLTNVPSGGCTDKFKRIEIPSGAESDYEQDIKFSLYPSGYDFDTELFYTIFAEGAINLTDFETPSKWVTNSRRRRMSEIHTNYVETHKSRKLLQTHKSRKLLQTTTSMTTSAVSTPAPTTEYGNRLNIEVLPIGDNTMYSGKVVFNGSATSSSLTLTINTATLKCDVGSDCVSYDECLASGLGFVLNATSCTTAGNAICDPMYPKLLYITVYRSAALCAIVFGVGNSEQQLPDWFWWVLIALIVFLLILAWLVYRYWWKQKKSATELGDAEDELDQQHADNEAGFGKDLDVGDVAFNPMATGVPGMNRPADAFGNELHQRQMQQQNDMVDVQAEVFQVRQDYGPVATGAKHHN